MYSSPLALHSIAHPYLFVCIDVAAPEIFNSFLFLSLIITITIAHSLFIEILVPSLLSPPMCLSLPLIAAWPVHRISFLSFIICYTYGYYYYV